MECGTNDQGINSLFLEGQIKRVNDTGQQPDQPNPNNPNQQNQNDDKDEQIRKLKARIKELEEELEQANNKNPNDPQNPQETPKDNDDNPNPPDQVPQNPEPTPEEAQDAEAILKNAENSDNKDELIEALEKTRSVVENSSNEDLKKQREKIEEKLGKIDVGTLTKITRIEIKNILEENGLKPEDLSSEVKTKYDELHNNNNNNNAQTIKIEIKIEIGEKTLQKIIAAVEQALNAKDKKQIEAKIKELEAFVGSKVDYKKLAYEKHKDKVKELLAKGSHKDQISPTNNKFPWGKTLLIGSTIAVVVGAVYYFY
jgi:hypothetical protein